MFSNTLWFSAENEVGLADGCTEFVTRTLVGVAAVVAGMTVDVTTAVVGVAIAD